MISRIATYLPNFALGRVLPFNAAERFSCSTTPSLSSAPSSRRGRFMDGAWPFWRQCS